MTIEQNSAGLLPGNLVEFLELDLTGFGGSFYRVFNSINSTNGTTITFLSSTWTSLPFLSEGFEYDGSGGIPTPSITLPDFDGVLMAASQQYRNLLGAPVIRYLTTQDNIAVGSYYGPERWIVNQKEQSDGFMIKFTLSTKFNQRNKKIPGLLMTRDKFPALGLNKWR